MRKIALLSLGVCVAIALPPRAGAQDADTKALIEKAAKAQGGAEKLAALKAITAKGKGNIVVMEMNVDFTIDVWSQPPGKSKAVVNASFMGMQIEIIQAHSGDKGWVSIAGQVNDMDKEDLQEIKEMEHVESVINLFGLLKGDKEFKFSPLGESKVGDAACIGIQVTKKDKRDVNLYFDKQTHLLVKAEYRARDPFTKQEVSQEKFYSDYKELLPGLRLPAKTRVLNDGKRFMDLELTEMSAVERHDDSIFARPN